MKASKLRDMTNDELRHQETQLADQIFRLRFQVAASQAENPSKIRLLRKDLARVKTVLREKIGPVPGSRGARAAVTAGEPAAAARATAPEPSSEATAKAAKPRRKAAARTTTGSAKPAAASGRKRATAARSGKSAGPGAKR